LTTACLALGAKVDDGRSPPLSAYLQHLSADVTLQQLQDAELAVLQALDYRVTSIATTHAFLDTLLLQLGQRSSMVAHLASYLAELTLLEYSLLPLPPSCLAAACYTYAATLLQQHKQAHALLALGGSDVCGYTPVQLAPVVARLSAVHHTVAAAAANGAPYAASLQYGSSRHAGVSAVPALLLVCQA
jgi:hypothetical protein